MFNNSRCDCCGFLVFEALNKVDGGPSYNILMVCDECKATIESEYTVDAPEQDLDGPTDYSSLSRGY